MLIQTRTILAEKGYGEQILERFSKESPMDAMEGLIDKSVSVNKRNKEHDEIMILIRWESEEAWKNWEKSDVHIQGHRDSRGKPKPEYIISTTVKMFEVKSTKKGKAANNG